MGGMMIVMLVVLGLLVALLVTVTVVSLCVMPQDVQDVFCFWVMLAVGVAIVLVSIVWGA